MGGEGTVTIIKNYYVNILSDSGCQGLGFLLNDLRSAAKSLKNGRAVLFSYDISTRWT